MPNSILSFPFPVAIAFWDIWWPTNKSASMGDAAALRMLLALLFTLPSPKPGRNNKGFLWHTVSKVFGLPWWDSSVYGDRKAWQRLLRARWARKKSRETVSREASFESRPPKKTPSSLAPAAATSSWFCSLPKHPHRPQKQELRMTNGNQFRSKQQDSVSTSLLVLWSSSFGNT